MRRWWPSPCATKAISVFSTRTIAFVQAHRIPTAVPSLHSCRVFNDRFGARRWMPTPGRQVPMAQSPPPRQLPPPIPKSPPSAPAARRARCASWALSACVPTTMTCGARPLSSSLLRRSTTSAGTRPALTASRCLPLRAQSGVQDGAHGFRQTTPPPPAGVAAGRIRLRTTGSS